jgi:hypothetical protein
MTVNPPEQKVRAGSPGLATVIEGGVRTGLKRGVEAHHIVLQIKLRKTHAQRLGFV